MATLHALKRASAAQDERSLVNALNDYLAGWGPAEVSRLPASLRPSRLRDSSDIDFWLDPLTEVYCVEKAETSEEHRILLAFFMAAADRLQQLGLGSEESRQATASFARSYGRTRPAEPPRVMP